MSELNRDWVSTFYSNKKKPLGQILLDKGWLWDSGSENFYAHQPGVHIYFWVSEKWKDVWFMSCRTGSMSSDPSFCQWFTSSQLLEFIKFMPDSDDYKPWDPSGE